MIFVADSIPPELRRIVEFLNVQMKPAEVLGVEVKRYGGDELTSLVSTVVGTTSRGKTPSATKVWTEETVFADMAKRRLPETAIACAKRLLTWARDNGLVIDSGKGAQDGALIARFRAGNQLRPLFLIRSRGEVRMRFINLAKTEEMADTAVRQQAIDMLNTIPGVSLLAKASTGKPGIDLTALSPRDSHQRFLECLEWILGRFTSSKQIP
jgi:hypothetical protein